MTKERISDALSVICTQVENLEIDRDILKSEVEELNQELDIIREEYIEKEKVRGWVKTLKSLTIQLYRHNSQYNRDKVSEELQKIMGEI